MGIEGNQGLCFNRNSTYHHLSLTSMSPCYLRDGPTESLIEHSSYLSLNGSNNKEKGQLQQQKRSEKKEKEKEPRDEESGRR